MSEVPACHKMFANLFRTDAVILAAGAVAYKNVAPQGAPYPRIIWSLLSGRDINGAGGVRVMTAPLFTVKTIDKEGNYAAQSALYDRVDLLLTTTRNVQFDNVLIQGCVRQQGIEMPEVVENVQYNHIGGIYQIWTNK